jgi:hypothetical protein
MGKAAPGLGALALSSLAACGGSGSSAVPALSVTPPTLSFAPQQLGSTSPPATVSVSNVGSAAQTVSVQLSGADAGSFSESNSCGNLAAGASCAIFVRFSPGSSGGASAALQVRGSAPAATLISLDGQGTTAATWTSLTNPPPEGLQLCLLLTDASVLCQAVRNWYRLIPDSAGNYVEGTWSLYSSFPPATGYLPQAFASAVLADGRIALMGGEYNYSGGQADFTLNGTGMIFDPVAISWSTLPPPPSTGSPNHWQCIGDAPASMLADGRWAIGAKLYQDVAVLDPATLSWSQVTAPGKTDTLNSEEGWTLLPDGSVLALDVSRAPATERLVLPAGAVTGAWVSAGGTPADLHTPTSTAGSLSAPGCAPYFPPGEMGPALLLPGGDVFAVGADGLTALYSPASDTWSAGPAVPNGLNVQDGPAALLPSGHVLFGASPGSMGQGLSYFEFDGAQLAPAPSPLNAASDSAFFTSLLPLPSGQVLFVDGSPTVQLYSPAFSPGYDPAWAPTVASVPSSLSPGSTYLITGTQFNGLSQASAFGDEYQNATNYPLVRLTNQASGHVFYARTHDHSTMGVATGSAVVSTLFDVPAVIESGATTLQVVANGIPSTGVAVTVN